MVFCAKNEWRMSVFAQAWQVKLIYFLLRDPGDPQKIGCAPATQGCQIGRFAAKFQVGWPYNFLFGRLGFFGRFVKVVWSKIFCVGRF